MLQESKIPYMRCPSDPFDAKIKTTSYVMSIGPQCAIGPCGYDPHQFFCTTAYGMTVNGGYTTSADHGNAWGSSEIRGVGNRLGAYINFASVTDGLSNTIFVGETAERARPPDVAPAVPLQRRLPLPRRRLINYCLTPRPGAARPIAMRQLNVSWGSSKHSGANF